MRIRVGFYKESGSLVMRVNEVGKLVFELGDILIVCNGLCLMWA